MSVLSTVLDLIMSSAWAMIVVPIVIIFYINYKALSSYKERPESYEQAVTCLKEDKFGVMYRHLLGIVLDKLADWLGDKPALKPRYKPDAQKKPQLKAFNRFFSSNPFTAPSYEILVRLAFIYPILSTQFYLF